MRPAGGSGQHSQMGKQTALGSLCTEHNWNLTQKRVLGQGSSKYLRFFIIIIISSETKEPKHTLVTFS